MIIIQICKDLYSKALDNDHYFRNNKKLESKYRESDYSSNQIQVSKLMDNRNDVLKQTFISNLTEEQPIYETQASWNNTYHPIEYNNISHPGPQLIKDDYSLQNEFHAETNIKRTRSK